MQPTTTTVRVLYVTDASADESTVRGQLGLDDDSVELSVAGSVEAAVEAVGDGTTDCVLCAASDEQQCLRGVRTLRGEYPGVPVVAFVGDDEAFAAEVLAAGAADVVQSTPEAVPEGLLRRRIDAVVTDEAVRTTRDRTRERYETILNTAVDPIYQLDPDGTVVAVNDAAVELLGYDRHELVGSHVSIAMDEAAVARGEELISEAFETGTQPDEVLDVELTTASGDRVPCAIRIAVLESDGEFEGTVGVVRDVSERRERERKLRERDELLEQISENVNDVVWVSTPEKDDIEFVSAAYEDIWGRSREGLLADIEDFVEGIHPDDRERVREALERQREDPESYDETYRVVQPDGEVRWVHDRAFGVYENGELVRIVGVAQDVTERRRRERELQAERDLVENIFEASPVGVLVVSGDGTMTRVNDRAAEILRVDREELLGENVADRTWHVVDDRGEPVPASEYPVNTVFDDGDPVYGWEAKLDPDDGEESWISVSAAPLIDEGEVTEAVIAIEDITERRQAQFDLRAEREFTEQLIDALDDVLYLFGEDGEFRRWNETLEEVTGYDAADLATRHPTELFEGEDANRVAEAIDEVLETGSTTVEADLVTNDGDAIPYEFTGARLTEQDGKRLICGIGRDISERKAREQQIARQRDELAQLDRLNAVIREVDQALVGATTREEIERAVCERLTDSGHYKFALTLETTADDTIEAREWTDAAEAYVDAALPVEGVTPAESPGLRALETGRAQVVRDIGDHPAIGAGRDGPDEPTAIAAVPITYEGREYGVLAVYSGETGTFTERESSVLDELGDTVGYAIAAVEQREREATLTSLYEATRALLGTETQQEVGDVVVDVATEVLELPAVGIFLFDEEENALRPVSATEELLDFYGGTTEFGPGRAESETWQSYVSGEAQYFEDIRDSERVANPDTEARSTLIFPLGDHGVFVAAADEVDVFDDQRRRLVGLLAATAETALDRVAGQENLRERDQRLEERTSKLEQVQRLTTLCRATAEVIRSAASRVDVLDGVCEALITHGEYDFAWAGRVPPDGTVVEPESWAGESGDYLDDVPLELGGAEPGVQTAASGDVTVVDNVTTHLRESAWAKTAVDYDYQSVLAVPLTHGGTTYGVLAVYATAAEAFDETTQAVLAEFGRLAAYGINTVETRQGILAEQVTELELRIEHPETFLNTVAGLAGETVQYREITPEEGDAARVLFELAEPPVDDVLALETEFVAVDSLTHAERGDQHLFRATVGSETVAATLLACGAIPTAVRASADETRTVVRLPQQLDVREFLDRVQESYPETELVSRQTVERQTAAGETVRVALEEELTDRQREVLVTAYESGFFESPRETTGAELADLLDVSQPTVTHHLREAQRRLFAELFEDTL